MSNKTENEIQIKQDEIPLPKTKFPSMSDDMRRIMLEICEKHKVQPYEMFSKIKENRLVHARRDYVCRCRKELPNASFPRIGRSLNQDHTTVLHGYNVAKNNIEKREPFTKKIYCYKKRVVALTPFQKELKEKFDEGMSIGEAAKLFGRTNKQISGQKAEIKRKMSNLEN